MRPTGLSHLRYRIREPRGSRDYSFFVIFCNFFSNYNRCDGSKIENKISDKKLNDLANA